MSIKELFEEIQDILSDDLKGELIIKGNCIIWTYDLDKDSEEIELPESDSDDEAFLFEAESPEELLLEAYGEDLIKIQEFIDENEEEESWTFSEPETKGNIISFRIF